jgi:hypothetical protein
MHGLWIIRISNNSSNRSTNVGMAHSTILFHLIHLGRFCSRLNFQAMFHPRHRQESGVHVFSPKSAIWTPISRLCTIHCLRIELPEEAHRLLVNGEYQRVRRHRPYCHDAPAPVQAPVSLPPVHAGEHVGERPHRVPRIRAHLAPHRVGGVEDRPVRDAGRGAPKHVIRHDQIALRSALRYLEFAHGLVGAVPT